jgi:hypothetical protein
MVRWLSKLHRAMRFHASLVTAMVVAGATAPSWAVLWDGGGVGSEWIEPANWQFNVLPNTADTATITNDAATITSVVVPTVFAAELGLGSMPGGLVMTGGANPAGLNVVTNVAVASAGSLTLGGGGPALSTVTASSLSTSGTTSVLSRGRVNLTGQLTQTTGTLNVSGGVINAATVLSQAGAFNAAGDINANVSIGNGAGAIATLDPGALLEIDGNLKFASDARLRVQFQPGPGGGVFDRVDVTGTVTLDGVLDLSILGGIIPAEGATYSILTAGALAGGFDSIVGLPAGDGSWVPHIGDSFTSINVTGTGIRGNMNGIGGVDEDDVELFAWAIRDANSYQEQFIETLTGAASHHMADMDRDNQNTFADIPLFLHEVALSGGDSQAAFTQLIRVLQGVPEPSAGSLAWGLAALLNHAARRSRRARGRPK